MTTASTIPSLTMRAAGAGDTALIADMHARSWAAAYRGIFPDAFLDHAMPAERLAHWQARMAQPHAEGAEVMLAELAGVPVGFMCVVEPDAQGSVLLDHLHVMPAQKGSGAGSAMLKVAERWARERGARGLHLLVLEANVAAIGFYASRGWQLSARLDDRLAGIDVIALRYTKPLVPV